MNKKAVIIIIAIVLILLVFYKIYLINDYKISENDKNKLEKITNGLLIKDLKVIYKEELTNTDYLEYKNIKIKNIFREFECGEVDNSYQCMKDEDTKFVLRETSSFIKSFEGIDDSDYKRIDSNKIIQKNKISNDIELFGLIKDASTSKNSIFKSIYQIKRDYILQKYAIDYLPMIHSMDLVEGEYSGYIFYISSNILHLYLTKNDHTYLFCFTNLEEFTSDVLQDFMNSIEITE